MQPGDLDSVDPVSTSLKAKVQTLRRETLHANICCNLVLLKESQCFTQASHIVAAKCRESQAPVSPFL
jgi:hypothetical protein